MKRLKFLTFSWIPVVIFACSNTYGSRSEANLECNQWKKNGKYYSYERELLGFEKINKFEKENPRPNAAYWDDIIVDWEEEKNAYASKSIKENNRISSRYCLEDQDSSSVFGLENNSIKEGTYVDEEGKKGEWKTVKSFRY